MTFSPKYFITEPWLTKTDTTPAIKNAGNKHKITCYLAYHFNKSDDAFIEIKKLSYSIGKKRKYKNYYSPY